MRVGPEATPGPEPVLARPDQGAQLPFTAMPPRLARLLAVIAALAMIGGALYYRGRGGSDGPPSNPTGTTQPTVRNGQLTIVCVTELADVCDAIAKADDDVEVTVEDAGTTAATLAKASLANPPFDAWITLAPWPQMVDAGRTATNLPSAFPAAATTVASSPLAAVMDADRFRALTTVCPTKTWACVAGKAGQSWADIAPSTPAAAGWGTFKVGVGDPDSALGRLVFGQIVQSVARAEKLGSDPGVDDFGDSLMTLSAPALSTGQATSDDQLLQLITQRGSLSLVAATASAASRFTATRAAQQQSLQAVTFEPAARADVVVAPLVAGQRAEKVVALFTDDQGQQLLDVDGWAPGAPKGSNGMPAADVLAALRSKIR